jgi:two-component system chemotaxis sensor kinase CheA
MKDPEFLKKLREAFAIEAAEHVQAITAGLIELEKTSDPARRKELVETIFRDAHSLKGAAGAVDHTHIQSVCQALEGVFASWKKSAPDVSAEDFDVLNRAVDLVGRLLRVPDTGEQGVGAQSVAAMVVQIGTVGTGVQTGAGRRPAPAASAVSARTAHPPEKAHGESPSGSVSAASAAPQPPRTEEPGAPAARASTPDAAGPQISDTVRIPIAKMDALLRQAEEMVSAKLAAHQHVLDSQEIGERFVEWHKEWEKVRDVARAEPGGQDGASQKKVAEFLHWNQEHIRTLERQFAALARTAAHHERSVATLVDRLLDDAKRLVMLPFGTLLDLFPKMVRDISRDLGKHVDLLVQGREVEIDKRILQEIKDPLIHLVRNSIDHGIEASAIRTSRGKPPFGTISITVSQCEGSKVEITVTDDGGGIPVDKLKASAVRNGVLSEHEAQSLNDQAALALIYQSGLSTSAIVTEISGRGLGMAIVQEKVEKLGGSISIESSLSKGTTFRIRVPVTLATFKGIVVSAGGQSFVIPTVAVERIARFQRADVHTVENKDTITLDGRPVSLVHLDAVLELPFRGNREQTDFTEVVVLGLGDRRIAFAVDAVRNEQEVLVKAIGKPLVRVRNVAGATVLGSGSPTVILNTTDLLQSAVHAASGVRSPELGVQTDREERSARNILVTDDSVTSRMLLKNILESAGYRVTTAVDGVDALTSLKTHAFDLLVSDVEMPRMDGFDLTAKVRADKKLSELPVVLVTALSSPEHLERGVDVGANAYVVKSKFDQTNLLDVIRKLI